MLSGIRFPEPIEYAELRTGGQLVGRAGWRCGKALDPAVCEKSYTASSGNNVSGSTLLVERAPGHFVVFQTAEAITRWLGSVDDLNGAALRACVSGYEIHVDATGEAEGDHWILVAYDREPAPRPHVLRVDRTGRVRSVATVHDE